MYAPSEEEIAEFTKWAEYARISTVIDKRDHFKMLIAYANGDRSLAPQETYDAIVGIDEIGNGAADIPTLQRRLKLMEDDITLSIDKLAIKEQNPLMNEEIFKTVLTERRAEVKRDAEMYEKMHEEYMTKNETSEVKKEKSNSSLTVLALAVFALAALFLYRT